MSDQFDEWDRFYARYEASLTPETAFRKYRKSRKVRKKLPQDPNLRARMEYEMRVEKRRVEALQQRADELVRQSMARASKSTTSS